MPPDGLSIRHLAHTRHGPVVVDVRALGDRYVATLIAPARGFAATRQAIAGDATEALESLVASIDTTVETTGAETAADVRPAEAREPH